MKLTYLFFVLSFLFLSAYFLFAQDKQVPFPDNWEKLNLVEEGEITKGNPLYAVAPGLHRVYANDIAYEHFKKYIKDYKAGKEVPPFPEGSLFVFVNFEDKKGQKPRAFFVMHKDKGYNQTGGWGWEGFKADRSRMVRDPEKECANCHYKGAKDWDGNFFPHYKE